MTKMERCTMILFRRSLNLSAAAIRCGYLLVGTYGCRSEDPAFIARRLVISAAEDIGLANPNALLLANVCFDALQK